MIELNGVYFNQLKFEVDTRLAEEVLDGLENFEMANIFNDEKLLANEELNLQGARNWNEKMVENLDENGRKHIKKLYDLVCAWYEANPEEAETEGYTEW